MRETEEEERGSGGLVVVVLGEGRVLRVVGGEVDAVVAVVCEAEEGRMGLVGVCGADMLLMAWQPLRGCGVR